MNTSTKANLEEEIKTPYYYACYLSGLSKKVGEPAYDFIKMNLILYYCQGHHLAEYGKPLMTGDFVVKQDKDSDMSYYEIIDRETFSKVVPMVCITNEEFKTYRETKYQEEEMKQYIISLGMLLEDYHELMNSENMNELFGRYRIMEHDKGYGIQIFHEICFNKKLKDKDYEHGACDYYCDTPDHPFDKYLEELYKT